VSRTYIEDWDEETHGKFPVRSQRYAGKRQVRLQDERGIWAGWCSVEAREIGKLTEDYDSRRAVPARYVAIALMELSPQETARKSAETAANEARLAAQQRKVNAKEAIRSKRENDESLTSDDVNTLADLMLGRDL